MDRLVACNQYHAQFDELTLINKVKLGEVHRLVSSKKDGIGGLLVACKSPIVGS